MFGLTRDLKISSVSFVYDIVLYYIKQFSGCLLCCCAYHFDLSPHCTKMYEKEKEKIREHGCQMSLFLTIC